MAYDNKNKMRPLKEKRWFDRATGSKERRNYIRTGASVPMTLRIEKAGGKELIRAVTRNISATGMMVEVNKGLSLGTEADIELNPPESSNPVHCSGKVAWSVPIQGTEKYNCGIEFIKIEEDNKNTFLKFLCDVIYKSGNNI